ncbi:MAG TPA: hypothetical protein VFC21_07100 [Bryobacteraceae bacterium]|nr:hypothetical protein [Bryobacteraceae bacterium]
MDHLHAQKTNAAERYLLGELPAEDAGDFELHYFECAQCALAVEAGDAFLANARAHFRDPESTHPHGKPAPGHSFLNALQSFWRYPAFTIPVIAALAAIALFQGLVAIPGLHRILNTARSLPAVQLIGASRGDEIVVHVPAGSPFVSLAADIPPGSEFKQYVCVLTNGARREISSSVHPAPNEGQPISVLIPAAQLRPGNHELTLFGLSPNGQRSDRISTYPFNVQLD